MNRSRKAAAPESGNPALPLETDVDPEIEALLGFEPVPRKLNRRDGWTADLQRRFIRLIVGTGTPQRAAVAINKRLSGIEAVYRDDEKGEFREAWDRAVELGRERQLGEVNAETEARLRGGVAVPAHRRAEAPSTAAKDVDGKQPLPGQVLNEHGKWEDAGALARRGEEAMESIGAKLTKIRRLFLRDISGCPGKRAAFEILTEWPIDWEKAANLEPQDDEPLRRPAMREPDMIMAAEAGWMGDLLGRGRNRWEERRAEVQKEMDDYHTEHGLPPIEWDAE